MHMVAVDRLANTYSNCFLPPYFLLIWVGVEKRKYSNGLTKCLRHNPRTVWNVTKNKLFWFGFPVSHFFLPSCANTTHCCIIIHICTIPHLSTFSIVLPPDLYQSMEFGPFCFRKFTVSVRFYSLTWLYWKYFWGLFQIYFKYKGLKISNRWKEAKIYHWVDQCQITKRWKEWTVSVVISVNLDIDFSLFICAIWVLEHCESLTICFVFKCDHSFF